MNLNRKERKKQLKENIQTLLKLINVSINCNCFEDNGASDLSSSRSHKSNNSLLFTIVNQ